VRRLGDNNNSIVTTTLRSVSTVYSSVTRNVPLRHSVFYIFKISILQIDVYYRNKNIVFNDGSPDRHLSHVFMPSIAVNIYNTQSRICL
jgi:hypothetical protein